MFYSKLYRQIVFGTTGRFCKFKSNPALWIRQPGVLRRGNLTTWQFIKTTGDLFQIILTQRLFLVPEIGFTQFKSKPCVINKTTSGFGVRKNNHQVIYQTNSVLFQIITAGCFLVPKVDFTQLKSNPAL